MVSKLSDFLQQFFAASPIRKDSPIVLAVSGGADSLALCLALRDYLTPHGGDVIAVSVDHGLRSDSAKECEQVGKWLSAYEIEHHILRLSNLPESNLQAAARTARYNVLADFCRERDILYLATGHHQDDVAETLTYRKEQGASDWAMAGIPHLSLWQDLLVIRPLLQVTKQDCIDYLHNHNQPWIEDASNCNPIYDRNRIRQRLAARKDYAVYRKECVEQARQTALRRRREELALNTWLARHAIFRGDRLMLPVSAFKALEAPAQLRVLKVTLRYVRGQDTVPRSHKLTQLVAQMLQPDFNQATLHHTMISQKGRQFVFSPEFAIEKTRKSDHILKTGETAYRAMISLGVVPFNGYDTLN